MSHAIQSPDCPYVGLAPFDTAHTDYFFGRSLDSAMLADNVLARRVCVLYGASGVGKSSVLNVGLPKALKDQGVTARIVLRRDWHDPQALNDWLDAEIAEARNTRELPLIVILDQFEEFFLYLDTTQVDAFAGRLADLADSLDLDAHVLVALRDDSMYRLQLLRMRLPTILNSTLELGHLDEDAVREAITGPVAVWNERHSRRVVLDSDFADTLIDQLRPPARDDRVSKGGRVELAYLQLALEQIWDEEGGSEATALRTGTLIDRLKGLSEISRRHVENVLRALPAEQQQLCAAVFDRLVTPSGGKILYPTEDLAEIVKTDSGYLREVLRPLSTGKTRLLRAVALPGKANAFDYEILHDVLARPIRDWTARREAERYAEEESKQREAKLQSDARKRAEADARTLRIQKKWLAGVALVAVIGWALAIVTAHQQKQARTVATALQLAAESSVILAGARAGGLERAVLLVLTANNLAGNSDVKAAQLKTMDELLGAMDELQGLVKIIGLEVPVLSVAFSPDGRRIVSGGLENEVRVWDAETGNPVGAPFVGHDGPVSSVAYASDGKIIVSGSLDKTVRLWDAVTGSPIGDPLIGHDGPVSSVAYASDGKIIVSGSLDKTVRLWDAVTGNPIGDPLEGHEAAVWSVAYDGNFKRIVSGDQNGTVRLWDATTGQVIGDPYKASSKAVKSVAFSPDGLLIVSGGEDKMLRLLDAERLLARGRPLSGHTDAVLCVTFSHDGRRVASSSQDKTVRLWDADSGNQIGTLKGHEERVLSVAFSQDGRRVVSGGWDKAILVWKGNANIEEPAGILVNGHKGVVSSVAFSPDNRRIVSSGWDGEIRFWDAETGSPIGDPLKGHDGPVLSVAYDPNGKLIASGGEDRTVRLWNAESGKLLDTLTGHEGPVLSVAYEPNGKLIASGGRDKTVRLWDAVTGDPVGDPLEGHEGNVTSVAFSHLGQVVVSTSDDQSVRLWNVGTGKPRGKPLEGHTAPVVGVALGVARSDDDSRLILSGSQDNTIMFWDAEKGERLGASLKGHSFGVSSVALSSDDRRMVSAGGDGELRIWPGPSQWPSELCAKLTKNMSAEQWQDWVSPDIEYMRQCSNLPPLDNQPVLERRR